MADEGSGKGGAVSGLRTAENRSAQAQALAADHGWFVFPVSSTKAPLWSKQSKYPDGSLNASKDESVIEDMFAPWPSALIAVRLDRSGLMCVDIDRHDSVDGMVAYHKLVQAFGALPKRTVLQTSLSGKGLHALFVAPTHTIRKNLKGYPGVDFLHHHYIVLSGNWSHQRSPYETSVKLLPTAWLEALKDKPKIRSAPVVQSDDPLRDILPVDYVKDLAGMVPNAAGFCECPGHEDYRPSLKVYNTAEAGWFCYQCERGGDVYDFAALIVGLPSAWSGDKRTAAQLMETVMARYEQIRGVRSEF